MRILKFWEIFELYSLILKYRYVEKFRKVNIVRSFSWFWILDIYRLEVDVLTYCVNCY